MIYYPDPRTEGERSSGSLLTAESGLKLMPRLIAWLEIKHMGWYLTGKTLTSVYHPRHSVSPRQNLARIAVNVKAIKYSSQNAHSQYKDGEGIVTCSETSEQKKSSNTDKPRRDKVDRPTVLLSGTIMTTSHQNDVEVRFGIYLILVDNWIVSRPHDWLPHTDGVKPTNLSISLQQDSWADAPWEYPLQPSANNSLIVPWIPSHRSKIWTFIILLVQKLTSSRVVEGVGLASAN